MNTFLEIDGKSRLIVRAVTGSDKKLTIEAIKQFCKAVDVKDVLLQFNSDVIQIDHKGVKENGN